MSETTAQTYIRRTRPFFQWLLDVESKLRENPFASVKMGKLSSAARKDFCRLSLRNQLIEKCTRPDLKFVLYCGFHAGLRRNEIVEARPCWFDLDNKLLTIRKIAPKEAARLGLDPFDLKDREERTIPLSKAFLEFLKQWQKGIKFEGRIEKLKMDQDYCIAPGTRRGRADYRYDFRRPFEEYMEEQKAEWVTPHTMRRTFASLHASAGTPLYHIAKWLGDDIGTTQKHYAHLAPDNGVFERGIG
jgi:integrase